MEVSIALAFLAGVASFVSPCVLALVPIYLAFIGESAAAGVVPGAGPVTRRGGVLGQALLFVLGFAAVFVLLGTSVGLLGAPLFRVEIVRRAAGVLIIALGLLTTGIFGPILERLWRSPFAIRAEALPTARAARSVALGALVSVGWTPCIGPVYAAILTMGSSSGSTPVAALLLAAYSAGLAVPFVAAAAGLPYLSSVTGVLRRQHRAVAIASGLLIMAIGVLVLVNAFGRLAGLFTFVI